jgi:serine/threonine-protein kinase
MPQQAELESGVRYCMERGAPAPRCIERGAAAPRRVETRPGLGERLASARFFRARTASSRVVAGKFRLLCRRGEGGMGEVWEAEDLARQTRVALKLMRPPELGDEHAATRFLREARVASQLRSPHVVQVFDCGMDGEQPFIVMELLVGESLADRLERVRRLAPRDTARVLWQLARAVGRAHDAGVVHRDLKPDNVFLVDDGEDETVKLLDFGIATVTPGVLGVELDAEPLQGLIGTPLYMSPEQAEERSDCDQRVDVWAFGVIAFECLLGRLPFEGNTLARLIVALCLDPMPVPSAYGVVPRGFDQWFARACARSPAWRFTSVRHAAAELHRVCAELPPGRRHGGAAA